MIRRKDILRSPIRSAQFVKREADWLRDYAAHMEDRAMPALPPRTTDATDRLHARLDAEDLAAAEGDHGIRNTEWGTTFITAEWLLSEALPRWAAVGYGPGRAEGNQDLMVLKRL